MLLQALEFLNMRSQITVSNCVFSQNSAQFEGGSIYIYQTGNITFENNSFYQNLATQGGAIYYYESRK